MYGLHFVGRNHKNFYAREGKLGPIVFSHMIDSDVSCDPLIRMILRYDFYPFLIILTLSAPFIFPLLSFTPLSHISSSSSVLHLLIIFTLLPPHSHHTSHTHTHSYTPPHHINSLTSPIPIILLIPILIPILLLVPILYISIPSIFHPSIISSFTQDRK